MGLDELNKLYLRQMNRDGQEQQAFVLGEGKQDNPLLMLVGEAPASRRFCCAARLSEKQARILMLSWACSELSAKKYTLQTR